MDAKQAPQSQPQDHEITLTLKMSETNVLIDALAARKFATDRLMNHIIDQGNSQLSNPVAGWKARKEMSGAAEGTELDNPLEHENELGIDDQFEEDVFRIFGTDAATKYSWGYGLIQIESESITESQVSEICQVIKDNGMNIAVKHSSEAGTQVSTVILADTIANPDFKHLQVQEAISAAVQANDICDEDCQKLTERPSIEFGGCGSVFNGMLKSEFPSESVVKIGDGCITFEVPHGIVRPSTERIKDLLEGSAVGCHIKTDFERDLVIYKFEANADFRGVSTVDFDTKASE